MNAPKKIASLAVIAISCAICQADNYSNEEFLKKALGIGQPFEYYVPPEEGCAIVATFFAIGTITKQAPKIKDVEIQLLSLNAPPFSMLDMLSVLEKYKIRAKALFFEDKLAVLAFDVKNAILHFRQSEDKVGHFSFCFKGRDGLLWIADPLYGGKCKLFDVFSDEFKNFTGNMLILDNEY